MNFLVLLFIQLELKCNAYLHHLTSIHKTMYYKEAYFVLIYINFNTNYDNKYPLTLNMINCAIS